MEEWKPYPRNRKFVSRENYVVIVPSDFYGRKGMPVFCDVCGLRFSSKEDEKSYQKFGCCSPCADTWAYSNSEEWTKGWRPSQKQVEESLQKRSFVNPNLVFE